MMAMTTNSSIKVNPAPVEVVDCEAFEGRSMGFTFP